MGCGATRLRDFVEAARFGGVRIPHGQIIALSPNFGIVRNLTHGLIPVIAVHIIKS